jgi:DNA-binding transcriptional regulator LsrR (DeoR family)
MQEAYDHAYQTLVLAAQIDEETGYEEAHLPFPSLLSEAERRDALAAVAHWRAELARLQASTLDSVE